MERRPKLDSYRRWKAKLHYEPYLDMNDYSARRALTELRSGTSKLRVETGRWERIGVADRWPDPDNEGGRALQRHERICRLCFTGVEDERHFLLECPSYEQARSELLESLYRVDPEQTESLRSPANTQEAIDSQYTAIGWAMKHEYRLVAQFIRKCNSIRRRFTNR